MVKYAGERKVIEKARELGLRVKRPGKHVGRTIYPHEDTWAQFQRTAKDLGFEMQEAATEALEMWVDSKTRLKKP